MILSQQPVNNTYSVYITLLVQLSDSRNTKIHMGENYIVILAVLIHRMIIITDGHYYK